MKKTSLKYIRIALILIVAELAVVASVPASVDTPLVAKANAEIFRRIFGRRPRSSNRGRLFGRRFRPNPVRVQPRRVVNQRNNNVNNRINNNIVRREDIKDLPGFNQLAIAGNAIVEKRLNPFTKRLEFRRLRIDRATGRLIGATSRETINQLKEFYLENSDKFRGDARFLVGRFLNANGARGALSGRLNVDLATGVTQEYEGYSQHRIATATLNFLLNSISSSSRLQQVSDERTRGGLVGINTRGFLRTDALALLTSENPYDCSGRGTAPMRLDYLVHRAIEDSNIYRRLLNMPDNLNDLGKVLGVETFKERTRGNKIVIASKEPTEQDKNPESLVASAPERTLEFQGMDRIPGRDFFISWDTNRTTVSGTRADSRNPFKSGINFTHDASEVIFNKANGFMAFYVANAAGKYQIAAPGAIARIKNPEVYSGIHKNLDTEVRQPVSCWSCHTAGYIGGATSSGGRGTDDYTNNFEKFKDSPSKQFFTSNEVYAERARQATNISLNAMKSVGAFLPRVLNGNPSKVNGNVEPHALIPDMMSEYALPITAERAAKELGLGKSEGALKVAEATIKAFTTGQSIMSRDQFAADFCKMKARVGSIGAAVSTGGLSQAIGTAAQSAAGAGVNHSGAQGQSRAVAE